MNTTAGEHPPQVAAERRLRMWPGVAIVALIVLVRYVIPFFIPEADLSGVLVGVAGAALVLIWWLFFSRAPWSERIGVLFVIAAAVIAIKPLVHASISNGFMGMMFYVYAVPSTVAPALVAWALFSRRLSRPARWVTMIATMFLACGAWMLLRTNGITGDAWAQLAWRWTQTAEERLLAQGESDPVPVAPAAPPSAPADAGKAPASAQPSAAPVAAAAEPTVTTAAKSDAPAASTAAATTAARATAAVEPPAMARVEWPGFRGSARDGIVHGVKLETDWSTTPPVKMWHRRIGPGWSSFAVQGDLLFTQEQRGEEEMVVAYRVTTGEPVWRHRDAARFWESNGGAGPRGTPTLHNGRVYALGATGILNVLDARNGAVIWSRNAASESGKQIPMWGFSSSPLIVHDMVVVAAAGKLAAYELATGKPRWFGPNGGGGYSSPHLATIDGIEQIVFLSAAGATGINPADGKQLWQYAWAGTPILQPALTAEGDVLVSSGDAMGGMGIRRLAVTHASGSWSVAERWASNGLKPYFSDFVVHNGHAFGFDGRILSCIDLKDGTRKWKGGRFGQGQLVLLPDQDLLLVLSEEGELGLVSATPDKFTEVARLPGIEGKTWNHPVLVRDTLLVRNDQEMAAFRLPLSTR
jgi:outer membrane protein assembly factor BamB